ncbi:MAG TPA: universal stress protein [Pseudonocardia sp.]|jgi:nucleotide-binding universal stress UspA family protein|nr:universal stress protein [Pseudonocardia sp.]
MGAYQKVIVGTDGSDTSMLAVDKAGALAGAASAELVIVCAYEPHDDDEVKAAADVLGQDAYQVVGSAPAESVLRDAAERARAAGAEKIDTLAVQGPPVDVLDQAVADRRADLLVVGNVGLNTLTGRILGSVPQSVARRAGVDVLIVHTS